LLRAGAVLTRVAAGYRGVRCWGGCWARKRWPVAIEPLERVEGGGAAFGLGGVDIINCSDRVLIGPVFLPRLDLGQQELVDLGVLAA
jgi:hypothetical protein